jgi:hypothetical protein
LHFLGKRQPLIAVGVRFAVSPNHNDELVSEQVTPVIFNLAAVATNKGKPHAVGAIAF